MATTGLHVLGRLTGTVGTCMPRSPDGAARTRLPPVQAHNCSGEAWHGAARAQAGNCSADILPMAAQPLSLAAGATSNVTFMVYLTSSAGAASLGCDVGVLDSQARARGQGGRRRARLRCDAAPCSTPRRADRAGTSAPRPRCDAAPRQRLRAATSGVCARAHQGLLRDSSAVRFAALATQYADPTDAGTLAVRARAMRISRWPACAANLHILQSDP
jgi:hypothetical protein